jgi:hypothetical protein
MHDNDITQNPQLAELVDLISLKYQQADNISEPDILILKTWELESKIREFYPGDFTDKDLYTAMRNSGFSPQIENGVDFVWLLKQR